MAVSYIVTLAILLGWEYGRPYFGFFREDVRARMRHDGFNLAVGAFNGLLITFGFATAWAVTAAWSESAGLGLLHRIRLPDALRWVLVFLMLDAWMYAWHRLNHAVPFLWRFHAFHHQDDRMDVTTASRFHAAEIIASSLLRVPLIALLGVRLEELVLYETLMFAVVQFHHADIRLPGAWDRLLARIIVTPDLHKVHHSSWQPETDSNYGSLFSFWDRIFGSMRVRPDPENIRFGVDPTDRPPSGAGRRSPTP